MFKTWVRGVGESTWASNGKTFYTIPQAQEHLEDLYSRWFGMEAGAVTRADAPIDGKKETDVLFYAQWTIGVKNV